MLDESLQVLNPPLEAQIKPHWFFNSCFSDEHEERIRQICWPVFPSGKR